MCGPSMGSVQCCAGHHASCKVQGAVATAAHFALFKLDYGHTLSFCFPSQRCCCTWSPLWLLRQWKPTIAHCVFDRRSLIIRLAMRAGEDELLCTVHSTMYYTPPWPRQAALLVYAHGG